jgi:hypothetical protein
MSPNDEKSARFQVLMAASMNMTAFWDNSQCSPVEVNRRFRGDYCQYEPLKRRSSTDTTRSSISEGVHLQ